MRLHLLALLLVTTALVAQEPPELRAAVGSSSAAMFLLQQPSESSADRFAPVVVVFAGAAGEAAARAALAEVAAPLTARGFVVVGPVREAGTERKSLATTLTELRHTVRIEQGGLHAAFGADPEHAMAEVLTLRHEFQTVVAFGKAAQADLGALRRLPARRVRTAESSAALVETLVALHAERRLPGPAGDVAHALDDFHDAAANADAERYFARLPDDAVFLGTDGGERWTGGEFRRFAKPFFARDSAWTYVTLRRHVDVEPDGRTAFFDEILANEAYGECRGSGVLALRDGQWVLRQYHLTVPVPNDLAREFANRIRTFQDHGALAAPPPTIVLVRHAEKVDASRDAALSDAGRARAEALAHALGDVKLSAAYVSEFQRTQATAAPTCAAQRIEPRVVPAADLDGLAARLRATRPGETVLVCGHSNTVPELLDRLGVADAPAILDNEYDRLLVVVMDPAGARLLPLRFGATSLR